jgi:hypothetical protein
VVSIFDVTGLRLTQKACAILYCFEKPWSAYCAADPGLGPRKQINLQSCLSFGPSSALRQKSHIDNMLPLARLEDEPKSGAILVYLFVSATLKRHYEVAT